MSSGYWHCAIDGQQQGPYSVDQLRDMASRGAVRPDTLVWTDGMAEWQPISATPLYAALAGGAPGPASRTAPPMPTTAMAVGGTGAPGVSFVDAVKICLTKYIDFSGRASRSEFWWFFLFCVVANVLTGWIQYVGPLVSLALLLPSIAVGVRRLHDTDRAGWWYLLVFVPLIGFIVLIVFWCQQGTQGRNRFG